MNASESTPQPAPENKGPTDATAKLTPEKRRQRFDDWGAKEGPPRSFILPAAGQSPKAIVTGLKLGQTYEEFKEATIRALRERGFFDHAKKAATESVSPEESLAPVHPLELAGRAIEANLGAAGIKVSEADPSPSRTYSVTFIPAPRNPPKLPPEAQ